jgi:hypothetical protein
MTGRISRRSELFAAMNGRVSSLAINGSSSHIKDSLWGARALHQW